MSLLAAGSAGLGARIGLYRSVTIDAEASRLHHQSTAHTDAEWDESVGRLAAAPRGSWAGVPDTRLGAVSERGDPWSCTTACRRRRRPCRDQHPLSSSEALHRSSTLDARAQFVGPSARRVPRIDLFERQEHDSRYWCFFMNLSGQSPATIAYVTEVDHSDRAAIIAIEPTPPLALGVALWCARPGASPRASPGTLRGRAHLDTPRLDRRGRHIAITAGRIPRPIATDRLARHADRRLCRVHDRVAQVKPLDCLVA